MPSSSKKILIIYASRHGSTKLCAEYIANSLQADTKVVAAEAVTPNLLHESKAVILGTAIYAGAALPTMKSFCKTHIGALCKQPLGLFVCGLSAQPKTQQKELRNAFPKELIKHASATLFAGGKIQYSSLSKKEKAILKLIGQAQDQDTIDYTSLDSLARTFS